MRSPVLLATLTVLVLSGRTVEAHYLWVTIDARSSEHGLANVIFEESPRPGDGGYLAPFVKGGRTWVRTLKSGDATPVKTVEVKEGEKRWLRSPLPVAGPRSVESYGKFGVYQYGDTHALLHYYAKCLDVTDHDEVHELGRAEKLALDIVPHPVSGRMELKVMWKDKPAPKLRVYVRGPRGFRTTVDTDQNGKARFDADKPGQYLVRTTLIIPETAGTDGGKAYDHIRHSSTLVIRLPLK